MHVRDPLQNRNTGVQEVRGDTEPHSGMDNAPFQGTRKGFLGEPSPALVSGRPPPEPLMGRARGEQGDPPFPKVYLGPKDGVTANVKGTAYLVQIQGGYITPYLVLYPVQPGANCVAPAVLAFLCGQRLN